MGERAGERSFVAEEAVHLRKRPFGGCSPLLLASLLSSLVFRAVADARALLQADKRVWMDVQDALDFW